MDAPKPPVQRRSLAPRCEACHRGHQKCSFNQEPGGTCDRCITMGKDCRMVELNSFSSLASHGNGDAQRRRRSIGTKCSLCRKHHMKCEPAVRVWPTKCDRCQANGYECSPPGDVSNEGVRDFKKRKAMEDSGGQQKHQKPSAMHTTQSSLVPVSADDIENLIKSDIPPAELSGHYRQDQFAPTAPNGRTTLGNTTASDGEKMVPEKMITDMEDEFQNVLTQQKKAHEEEIKELKRNFEAELADIRSRHEKRLDDMLSIMSRMGSKS